MVKHCLECLIYLLRKAKTSSLNSTLSPMSPLHSVVDEHIPGLLLGTPPGITNTYAIYTQNMSYDCSPLQLAFYIWDKFSYCLGPSSPSLLKDPLLAFLTGALSVICCTGRTSDDTLGLLRTNRITLLTIRTIALMIIYLFCSWEHCQAQPTHV